MVPQQQIDDFVTRLQQAAGANLQSVILYGSAASAEFVAEFSDVNLLCILGETSFPALAKLAPVMEWWSKRKHPTPLVMTLEELRRSADVFAIEVERKVNPAASTHSASGWRQVKTMGFTAQFLSRFRHVIPARADNAGRSEARIEARGNSGTLQSNQVRSFGVPAVTRHS